MSLIDALHTRHTVKSFDAGRPIAQADVDALLGTLHLSASSVNSQPWHYVVASTPEGRARIAKATQDGYAYNAAKVLDASHVVALCVRADFDEAHLNALLQQEAHDGRFANEDAKAGQDKIRRAYVDLHRYQHRDLQQWMEKQVYLALGGLLVGAAALGVDATPMEGFDQAALDLELGLRERGYTSVVLAAFGHRSDQDFNAALPKSRLPREQVFTFI